MAYTPQKYDFQGQVPTAAIIQAYQQKAMQEYQAKQQQQQVNNQKHQEVLQTIQMAAGLVQQGVTMSAQRQQKEAKKAFLADLQFPEYGPTGGITPMSSSQFPGVHSVPKMEITPEYKNRLKAEFAGLYGDEFAKEQAKAMFQEPTPISALDTARTGLYNEQTNFLKSGKPEVPKPEKPVTDLELYQNATKEALDSAKAANKYGEMTDEGFLPKVKADALQRFEEMKQIRDKKKLILSMPDGRKAEVTPIEWAQNRDEYLAKGFKLFTGK